jgi:hypothetical protein
MKSQLKLSPEVYSCASAAGYTATTGDESADGHIEFSAGLGETRNRVRVDPDGMVVVNVSERLEPEYMVFAAPAITTIERYLLMTFGSTIRFRKKMPRIRIPVAKDHLAEGYDLAPVPLRGDDRLALIRTGGETVAWSRSDPTIATIVLVELSYHMTGSYDDIAASYLSTSGAPLYGQFTNQRAN